MINSKNRQMNKIKKEYSLIKKSEKFIRNHVLNALLEQRNYEIDNLRQKNRSQKEMITRYEK